MRLIALGLLISISALAVWLTWRHPGTYAAQDRLQVSVGSSALHPAGTDELGRDRAVRTAMALLLGLTGAVVASAIASASAVGLGALAGFLPRWVGSLLLFGGDLFLTLPWIFLLMLVRAALPLNLPPLHSAAATFLLLAILGVPAFLRVNYTKTVALRNAGWWAQAHALGLRPAQIARGVLPHLRPLLITQFLLYIPACMMAEANLGTLGLGIAEPLPSWGSMLGGLQSAALLNNSHLIYLPVLLLVVVLTSLELLVLAEER